MAYVKTGRSILLEYWR